MGQAAEDVPGKLQVSWVGGAVVQKFDANGDELWLRHFRLREISRADRLALDRSSNVIVVGLIDGALPGQTALGQNGAFLRVYTPEGRELWTRQFRTDCGDIAVDVTVTDRGDIDVVGSLGGGGADGTRRARSQRVSRWFRVISS